MLNSIYLKQVDIVLKKFPNILFDKNKGKLFGTLLIDESDSYNVEIDLMPFPQRFPVVWEIGERIPRKLDRHIYTEKGNCCFTTSAKEQILLKKRIKTIFDFIYLIAIPYFQNNSYYEINKKYKYGEYDHKYGNIQGYSDILNVEDIKTVIGLLYKRLNNYKFNRNDKCFCGNNKKIKVCHLYKYNDLFLVDDETIKYDLIRLKEQLNNDILLK